VRLAQLYLICGNARDGVSLLRDKIEEHPEQRMLLAELLIESRSTEEASSVVEDLVQQARARLEADPTQLSIRVELADALRTLKRHREASGLFLELKDENLLAAVRNSSAALTARGLAYGAEFDRICGLQIPIANLELPGDPLIPSTGSVEELIGMLVAAAESDTAAVPAIDRLARLVIADGVACRESSDRAEVRAICDLAGCGGCIVPR
jgi:hypothetical protein